MRIQKNKLIENIELLLIFTFCIYTFWFQYGVMIIAPLITITGLGMLVVFLVRNRILAKQFYKNLSLLFAFIVFAAITGVLFSGIKNQVIDWVIQIMKFLIPMLSIIDYVRDQEEKCRKVMWIITLSGFLLSVYAISNGTRVSNSGITLGDLNTNVLASYLVLTVFAILFLFSEARFTQRLFLAGAYAVSLLAVFNSASRRGAIQFVVLSAAYLYFFCVKTGKGKVGQKFILIAIAICSVIYLLSSFSSLLESSALLQRLTGGGDTAQSDMLRKLYQLNALTLFKSSPIFGCGLGSVATYGGVHSHSLYFESLACTGIIGLLLIVSFLILNIRSLLLNLKGISNGETKMTILFTASFIALILLTGIQVTYIYDSFFYIMIGCFVSISNCVKSNLYKNDKNRF